MTTESFTPQRPGFAAKFAEWMTGPRDMARSAMRETMTWSFYQWTVLALLTATFILLALAYSGIRAELAALKGQAPGADPAGAVLSKQIADTQALLVKAISEMKAGLSDDIAKIGAKFDTRSQAVKPVAPATKPAAKPRQ